MKIYAFWVHPEYKNNNPKFAKHNDIAFFLLEPKTKLDGSFNPTIEYPVLKYLTHDEFDLLELSKIKISGFAQVTQEENRVGLFHLYQHEG